MPKWTDLPENKLLEFLNFLDSQMPGTALVYFSATEKQFAEAVEVILDLAIRTLEQNAASHKGLGELALSTMLADLIRHSGIPCEKESYRNGHVDVTIAHPRLKQYQYLGECKIYAGFKRHCNGCHQLLNRYSSGRDLRGFLLEFVGRPQMYKLLQELREEFDQSLPLKMKGKSYDQGRIKGAFISIHTHFTNAEVQVLHLGCNLYCP
jgi:hypothetical protein